MAKIVTVFGGSGFLGRYVAQRMAHRGWRVRVAVRRPNEAIQARTYGAVGQVEPVICNIRDDASVADALSGADAAVNCVGILVEAGKNTFDAVQHLGADRIARTARAQGVRRLVHVSAIGADPSAKSGYARSKGMGEAAVMGHCPEAVILRPSVMFGPEDRFFNRFAAMAARSPVLPLVGAQTRIQPVYVDDVARAAEVALTQDVPGGVYELGGPQAQSLRAWVALVLGEIGHRRWVVNLPFPVAHVGAWWLDLVQKITLGLFVNNILTRDQVRLLRTDNVVGPDARGLRELGIQPATAASVLPDYLWMYRTGGQYAAIRESARNLKV